MDVKCNGNGSIAGNDLFLEYSATTSVRGSWNGKGTLHLDGPSALSGRWESKRGDLFPIRLRRLKFSIGVKFSSPVRN